VERDGIQNGIDRFVRRKGGELKLFTATPHIVRSELVQPGSGADSDIQNDFDGLPAAKWAPLVDQLSACGRSVTLALTLPPRDNTIMPVSPRSAARLKASVMLLTGSAQK
jgi:hypothetical protein